MPTATTVNVAGWPSITVAFAGWELMVGAVLASSGVSEEVEAVPLARFTLLQPLKRRLRSPMRPRTWSPVNPRVTLVAIVVACLRAIEIEAVVTATDIAISLPTPARNATEHLKC